MKRVAAGECAAAELDLALGDVPLDVEKREAGVAD
jgi:hypothetical protein